jgi:23S rRNA (adenine2503-C2)-methyltransferase
MKSILTLSREELAGWLQSKGQPAYRAGQIRQWLFQGRATSFEAMSNLPKALRQLLADDFLLYTARIVKHSTTNDGTEKLLLELPDHGRIECVLLREGERRSICISSQVGCAMGCVFCASGLDGVDRNLTPAEIIEQMLLLQNLLPAEERLSHIVVMGMGEPLANVSNVLAALDWAASEEGLGISARRITISTVGIPAAIERMTQENSRYNLAVSLHAPNDDLRTQIVPVNKSIGIREILTAADHYFEASGRKLTFEYVLLADVNDHPDHARQLARLLGHRTALVNVIPYNPVAGLPYSTPSDAAIRTFREILEAAGINVQFRARKGDRINAACGQLRRSFATPLVSLQMGAGSSDSTDSNS